MRHCPIDPGQYADMEKRSHVIRVMDYMTRPAVTIGWEEPVAAAWSVMQTRSIRHLPVIDADGLLVGVVTETDLKEAIADLPAGEQRRSRVMEAPVTLIIGKVMVWGTVAVQPDTDIGEAARLMHDRKLTALPVTEDGHVVGMLTQIDILKAFIAVLEEESAPKDGRCGF